MTKQRLNEYAAAAEIDSKAPQGVDYLINNAGICGTMGLDFEAR